MSWWVLELARVVVLAGGAVAVQQLIRRHGVAYAEEVFRETPRAGVAFLALADIAYYLLVVAFIAFTARVERYGDVTQSQFQDSLVSVGGLALILGALHAFNIFILPSVGRALAPRPPAKRVRTGS